MQVNRPKSAKTFLIKAQEKKKKQANKQKKKQAGVVLFLAYITDDISLKYDLKYI